MRKYTTLLFDTDDTLLDFYAAEGAALNEVLTENGLVCNQELHKIYSAVNKSFWEAFERGEIKKSDIYVGRYRKFLEITGMQADPEIIAKGYEEHLCRQHFVLDGALQMCERLSRIYDMYIITNGMQRVQENRLRDSGIGKFFSNVFISETIGCPKPEKKYFDYVLSHIREKDKSKVLVIGDSQSSDMKGGINSGIDTCWYNPHGISGKLKPTYTVKSFSELEKMLQI